MRGDAEGARAEIAGDSRRFRPVRCLISEIAPANI